MPRKYYCLYFQQGLDSLSKIMAIVFLVIHSTCDDEEALYNMKATLSVSDANLLT